MTTTSLPAGDLLAGLQLLPQFLSALHAAAAEKFKDMSADIIVAEDLAKLIEPLLPLLPIPYEAQIAEALKLSEMLLPLIPVAVRVSGFHIEGGAPPWYHPGPGR